MLTWGRLYPGHQGEQANGLEGPPPGGSNRKAGDKRPLRSTHQVPERQELFRVDSGEGSAGLVWLTLDQNLESNYQVDFTLSPWLGTL